MINITRKNRRVLLAVSAIIILSGVVVSFLYSRFRPEGLLPDASGLNTKATLSASNIQHESVKNGVKQWSLKADRVDYFDAGRIAEFTGASATFFTAEGKEAGLSAGKCRISVETGDFDAEGDVLLTHMDHSIKTARLNYMSKRHIIESKEKTGITGTRLNMTADSFILDLDRTVIICTGDVKGTMNGFYP